MRRRRVIGAAMVALGFGWLGPTGTGAAPVSLVVSVPRPQTGVASPAPLPSNAPIPELEASLVVAGLDRPTFAVAAGDGRLLVTEKSGVIRVVVAGEILAEPFLDLSGAVEGQSVERGLLALTLHPRFSNNGRFYVHLTDNDGNSRLIEYRVSAGDPGLADPTSARLILAVEQPGEFHNGGMLQFGPDGYLWVAFGDGDFGDSSRNARLRQNVLGSILRIDVDAADPYAVPADNPYVGTDHAAEIWLNGMRNPWRFSIDAATRQIVIGDVGQFLWEEITVLPLDGGGLDLGWPRLEGETCYQTDHCATDGLTMPDVVYSHSFGCAVVAGPVYRGSLIPELEGMIVYADYCTGFVQAFALLDGHVLRQAFLLDPGGRGPILSLAVDDDGEILLLTEMGEIRRLEPAASYARPE